MTCTLFIRRAAVVALGVLALLTAAVRASVASAAEYVPGEVVVGFASPPMAAGTRVGANEFGVRRLEARSSGVEVLRVARGMNVWTAIARIRREPGVAYAVPNYIAHLAGSWIPNDRGRSHFPRGWEGLQWNFLSAAGVDAPGAWANLIAEHRPGGRGAVVAILDTGVAYRNWRQFRKSPDFAGTRFVDPYDFVAGNRYPLDREGHGTFISGTLAEATNNKLGLTGLAYGAKIMPIRVLDANGNGDAATISKGIYYAVAHGAQVINLSLEFDLTVTASEINDVMGAVQFAHRRGVVVVAASGNDSSNELAYPARAPAVISVGATTRDRCLAAYSNGGAGLDLVAPGGGDDSSLAGGPSCQPQRNLPDIYQMTFPNSFRPSRFGLPGGWYGTSMAAAHVSATAALVIASGVVGRHPTPEQVLTRLEQTASPVGGSKPNGSYGYGLVDAAAATAAISSSARSHRRPSSS